MNEKIKVSVVIPTYRRPNMLARLLDSILEQNFPNFEIIVITDEKTNCTNYESIVDRYSKRFNFFTFLNNEVNKGAPYSRNRGINLAKANFICLIDDDDEMLPKKIKMQYQKIKNSDLDIVYTFTYVSENNERVKGIYESRLKGNLKKQILKNCFIPSPSVMVKKSSIISAGLFDLSAFSLNQVASDLVNGLLVIVILHSPILQSLFKYHRASERGTHSGHFQKQSKLQPL